MDSTLRIAIALDPINKLQVALIGQNFCELATALSDQPSPIETGGFLHAGR